jgi:hypothetical protein
VVICGTGSSASQAWSAAGADATRSATLGRARTMLVLRGMSRDIRLFILGHLMLLAVAVIGSI